MIFALYTPTYSPLTFLSSHLPPSTHYNPYLPIPLPPSPTAKPSAVPSVTYLIPYSPFPPFPYPTPAKPAAVAAAKPVVPALERARQAKAVEDAKALQVSLLTLITPNLNPPPGHITSPPLKNPSIL